MNTNLGFHRRIHRVLLFLIFLFEIATCSCPRYFSLATFADIKATITAAQSNGTENTTNTADKSPPPESGDTSSIEPMKPWLIGVIVLSAVVVIGATITVIQRCRKRGQDSANSYTIGDYES